jgi:hypothetical protein
MDLRDFANMKFGEFMELDCHGPAALAMTDMGSPPNDSPSVVVRIAALRSRQYFFRHCQAAGHDNLPIHHSIV